MKNLRYHHIGIPNTIKRDREDYFLPAKMFHTNFDDNPYGIEWLRFEPGSHLPEVAFLDCPFFARPRKYADYSLYWKTS